MRSESSTEASASKLKQFSHLADELFSQTIVKPGSSSSTLRANGLFMATNLLPRIEYMKGEHLRGRKIRDNRNIFKIAFCGCQCIDYAIPLRRQLYPTFRRISKLRVHALRRAGKSDFDEDLVIASTDTFLQYIHIRLISLHACSIGEDYHYVSVSKLILNAPDNCYYRI